ncbi:MAG: hypothetical protein ACLU37_09130 [Collinsella sp.]
MNILVLLPVNDRHRAILESSAPGEDFIYTSSDAATREQVADADVILGNIDPDMLTACEHLQLLQLQTAGYDDYLAAGTVPADAKLSCSVGAYGQAVSEHMFVMILSMMKRLPGYHDLQREHRWRIWGRLPHSKTPTCWCWALAISAATSPRSAAAWARTSAASSAILSSTPLCLRTWTA